MFSAGRVLLMPKGAYNPLTTYEMLDIVSYNGSSYIAKGTTTGNLPTDTTYWQLSAYGGQAANMAGNFAELESSSVATATHYVDDIFVDENSQLMKATQTINIGDTIDANVNCAPTTVEALIAYLSSYVDSLDSLNKKIQGAIEIAAQTDLHSLAIGEYYKKQSTFYVTNGPTGIDQDPTAIFRLTVEAALDNASQASSPLLLTLRTPDGKIYTQGFDGTNWGSWEQIAVESSVADVDTRVDSVESSVADVETSSTASKAYAIGKSFYYNDVLYKATAAISQGGTITPGTNCTPEKIIEKIEDLVSENQTLTQNVDNAFDVMSKNGAKNLLLNKASSQTVNGITFTVNSDKTITASGTASENAYLEIDYSAKEIFNLPNGNYILSGGISSNSFVFLNKYDGSTLVSNYLATNDEVVVPLDKNGYTNVTIGIGVNSGQTLNNVVFKPMLRLASDIDNTYEPYSMTNQEITPYVQAISNPNLLDNPWFTVNQRGLTSVVGGYIVDRWNGRATTGSSLSDGVVTIVNNRTEAGATTWWGQRVELDYAKRLIGKVLTWSVMLSDGEIKTYTFTIPNDSTNVQSADFNINGNLFYMRFEWTETAGCFFIWLRKPNSTISIKAVKLELGSVSTLAQDTAPNYATELLKCQRYFINAIGNGASGYFNDANAILSVPVPVQMRTVPTVTLDYANNIIDATGNVIAVPANAAVTATQNQHNAVRITVPTSRTATGILPCVNADTSFNFSADL